MEIPYGHMTDEEIKQMDLGCLSVSRGGGKREEGGGRGRKEEGREEEGGQPRGGYIWKVCTGT
jgi:hypothetical protein